MSLNEIRNATTDELMKLAGVKTCVCCKRLLRRKTDSDVCGDCCYDALGKFVETGHQDSGEDKNMCYATPRLKR
jgi:hypothetical protein